MRLVLLSILITTYSFVNAQQTYVPDDNFEDYLENNSMGNGIPNDDYVTTANISGVSSLIIWGLGIADLTGIEDFASLTQLFCFNNSLNSLDVTQNTMLGDLRCYNNNLSALDVTQNPSLSTLLCFDNNLNVLDVTQNPWLTDFSCYDNNLNALDLTQNTFLNFVLCNNNNIASLDLSNNTSLTNLRCYDNNLTTLDLSQNPNMTTLLCFDNNLTSLDVTGCPLLSDLRCFDNQLTSLDVSQCAALGLLICNDNLLTTLDVTQCPALVDVLCQNNQLECLLANNGQNITLDCTNNLLSCVSVVYGPWAVANALYDPGVSFDVVCQYTLDNDVDQDGTSLTAVQNGAQYQWLDCNDNYAPIDETNQTYSPLTTGSYAVEITWTDACGGVHIDTSSCHFHYVAPDNTSLEELSNGNVELVKIIDLMGRETPYKPNTTLIYIYSDGTTEKVFGIED